VWSVGRSGDGYVALAGEIDTGTLEIHDLVVGADRQVSLGPHRALEVPGNFVPSLLFGVKNRLLIGGARVEEAQRITIDYTPNPVVTDSEFLLGYNPPRPNGVVEVPINTMRPALFEVRPQEVVEVDIAPTANLLGWGTITDIAVSGAGRLKLRIDGSSGFQEPYGERVIVAESAGRVGKWRSSIVRAGLGEGWPGGLTVAKDHLVTVAVDQAGRRTIFQKAADGETSWVGTDVGIGGPVLGVVTDATGDLIVFDADGDRIRTRRFSLAGRQWQTPAVPAVVGGSSLHAMLTVGGSPHEWLAIGDGSANLVSTV
jgi:hypothetical protein